MDGEAPFAHRCSLLLCLRTNVLFCRAPEEVSREPLSRIATGPTGAFVP